MKKIRAHVVRETRRMLASLDNIWRSLLGGAALPSLYKARLR
ncbi:hypothetical protein [Dyella sp.]|nr:hypothetical protein [Dyella sp.]HKT30705.1 hypothetical protein [Dyella sp.]